MKRALLLLGAVLVSLAVAAARAGADTVGTLQVDGSFGTQFDRIDCPAGTPATTACHPGATVRSFVFPGLGEVTTKYVVILENFGSTCMQIHAQVPIVVAGKGEIDLAAAATGCVTPEQLGAGSGVPMTYAVAGGSGSYAGASGSGVLTFRNNSQTGPESGYSNITWTGTLNVPGLAFDTTAPQVTGATSKVVKTRLAKGARVAYAVKATDATDGAVAPACLPKSGSLFPVGRTTVTCNPTDKSGNPATARFTITVKRVR